MEDWKQLIDQAMQTETSDTIEAPATYGNAVRAALAPSQTLLGDLYAAPPPDSIHAAFVPHSQHLTLRITASSPEIGAVDITLPTDQS